MKTRNQARKSLTGAISALALISSEAIRHLMELGLAAARPMKQRSPRAAARASEMAAEQVEKLMSPLLPEEERRTRKRRLIKGPKEFREMPVPKSKG